MLPISLKMEKS